LSIPDIRLTSLTKLHACVGHNLDHVHLIYTIPAFHAVGGSVILAIAQLLLVIIALAWRAGVRLL
jgi:hypothetical protein